MLQTDNIKTGGGGVSKTLLPGNQEIKILAVSYRDFTFKPGGLEVILHCEGKPMEEGFEGFFIDKDDQSKGRHAGQVGQIRSSAFAYADGTTKSGIVVNRDNDILRLIQNICNETDCKEWPKTQNNKHATIQSLLDAFNTEKPFADKFLNVCVAGKEYNNKQNFLAYDLFFPKANKTGYAFEKAGKTPSKVLTFNETDHIIKKAAEGVAGFEGTNDAASNEPQVQSDFKL